METLRPLLSESEERGGRLEGGLRLGEVRGASKLILRGRAAQVDYALRLLRAIDQPPAEKAEGEAEGQTERMVEIIDVEEADPAELVALLESFLQQTPGRAAPARTVSSARRTTPTTSRSTSSRYRSSRPGPTGFGRSGPTVLIADPRTGKIIVQTCSARDLADIKMLVRELDRRFAVRRVRTQIYHMKHLEAADSAALLSRLFGDHRIVPHQETNSLVIQAEPEEFEEIQEILSKIDVPPPGEDECSEPPAAPRSSSEGDG
jgi:type II secretory pathway component GspD/PulD (secretin)